MDLLDLFAWSLLNCCLATLLTYWFATLLTYWLAILIPCWLTTLLASYTLLTSYLVDYLPCWLATLLTCYLVDLLPCWLTTLFNCSSVALLNCCLFDFWIKLPVDLRPLYLITVRVDLFITCWLVKLSTSVTFTLSWCSSNALLNSCSVGLMISLITYWPVNLITCLPFYLLSLLYLVAGRCPCRCCLGSRWAPSWSGRARAWRAAWHSHLGRWRSYLAFDPLTCNKGANTVNQYL